MVLSCRQYGLFFVSVLLFSMPLFSALPTTWDSSTSFFDTLTTTQSVASNSVVTVSGEVEIRAGSDCVLTMGDKRGLGITIQANAADSLTHLIFNVTQGATLEIQVLENLSFKAADATPFYVSFRGKGTTLFRLPCGRTLSFDPSDTDNAGTHVRTLMEQESAFEQSVPQLLFSLWSYDVDSTNTDLHAHTWVRFKKHSSLTFLSYNYEGDYRKAHGYGSIAFDPSHKGTGRLILDLAGDGTQAADALGNDAAFTIAGARVISSNTIAGGAPLNADMVSTERVSYTHRAGLQATLGVLNTLMYEAHKYTAGAWQALVEDPTSRRGLVILNHNTSLPRFANNFEQASSSYTIDGTTITYNDLMASEWFKSKSLQPGFIVGNNGVLSVAENCFIDYYALGTNTDIIDGIHVAAGKRGTTHTNAQVKKHNPSALFIDGLADTNPETYGYVHDATDRAQIILYGNAGVLVRAGVMPNTEEELFISDAHDETITYIAPCKAQTGKYSVKEQAIVFSDEVDTDPVGAIALDFEGACDIVGKAGVTGALPFITMPSILTNHAGEEMRTTSEGTVVVSPRPLLLDTFYRCTRKSACLLNATVALHNSKWIHKDPLHHAGYLPTPGVQAQPALIGGELSALRNNALLSTDPSLLVDTSGPAFFLFNSTIELHDSLVAAGIRFIIHEIDADEWNKSDNRSFLVFYKRGNELDRRVIEGHYGQGYGVVFQLGSQANTMADGITLDPVVVDGVYPVSCLRDSFIDIYRSKDPRDTLMPLDEENVICLECKTATYDTVSSDIAPLQSLYLSNRSHINLGWKLPFAEATYYPWSFTPALYEQLKESTSYIAYFDPTAYGRGTLEIAGKNIYIGAGGRYNRYGVLEPAGNASPPQQVSHEGGVLFVGHGGHLKVRDDKTDSVDFHLDTIIARQVEVKNLSGALVEGGVLTIPSDQIIMHSHGAIHPHGVDYSDTPYVQPLQNTHIGVVTIDAQTFSLPSDFVPVKSEDSIHRSPFTRGTPSRTTPVKMPESGVIKFSTGNSIDQFVLLGATRAIPAHLWLSGDAHGFARIREFVTVNSQPPVLGEGTHAALFLDGGARCGLGSRAWNEHSVRAWNQLGEDKVTIYAHGNGVVDLNSNIIITDKLPLIATSAFGTDTTQAHQITFYSEVPREIRVLAGGELDLSSFGQATTAVGDDQKPYHAKQQIAFGGKVRLVLEPGAKIRFPHRSEEYEGLAPVLYFTDDAEIVFLGNDDRDEGRWTDGLSGSDKVRCKLMGVGNIWLNKNAQLKIFDAALVGVEADEQTPRTNITLSCRRESQVLVGSETNAGGAFQIGNMIHKDGNEISFSLLLNGPGCRFYMGRESFFGLGAGTINKAGSPNAYAPAFDGTNTVTATTPLTDGRLNNAIPVGGKGAWRVQQLRDVKDISITIKKGVFDHSKIFDGNHDESSALVVGPLEPGLNGRYALSMGSSSHAFMRGGGNLVYLDMRYNASTGDFEYIEHDNPLPLNIWDRAGFPSGLDNAGKYTIMAPSSLMRIYPGSLSVLNNNGASSGADDTFYTLYSSPVVDADHQAYAMQQFYLALGMNNIANQSQKIIAAGSDQLQVIAGYVNGSTIRRRVVGTARSQDGSLADPRQALEKGYFIGSSLNNNNDPETIALP